MSDELIEKTFQVSGKAVFSLSNIRGSVKVESGAAGEISVKASKRRSSGDANRTEIIMEQAEDGSVKVETRFENSVLNLIMLSFPCEVDYTVSLPEECDTRLSCVSADLSLKGVRGLQELSMVSGDIELESVSGDLHVTTVSGEIAGAELSGKLKLKSVSGGVRLGSSHLDSLEANTVSGGIHVQSPIGAGPYHFHSVSGRVRLEVPDETACRVDLSTVSGEVRIELPGARHGKDHGRIWAEVGSGGAHITAHSVSGDVRITSPGGEASQAAPKEQQAARQAAKDRMAILARIERGEISAEEALRELQAE